MNFYKSMNNNYVCDFKGTLICHNRSNLTNSQFKVLKNKSNISVKNNKFFFLGFSHQILFISVKRVFLSRSRKPLLAWATLRSLVFQEKSVGCICVARPRENRTYPCGTVAKCVGCICVARPRENKTYPCGTVAENLQ